MFFRKKQPKQKNKINNDDIANAIISHVQMMEDDNAFIDAWIEIGSEDEITYFVLSAFTTLYFFMSRSPIDSKAVTLDHVTEKVLISMRERSDVEEPMDLLVSNYQGRYQEYRDMLKEYVDALADKNNDELNNLGVEIASRLYLNLTNKPAQENFLDMYRLTARIKLLVSQLAEIVVIIDTEKS